MGGVFVLGVEFYQDAFKNSYLNAKTYQSVTLATELERLEPDPPIYYSPPEPFRPYSQYGISLNSYMYF